VGAIGRPETWKPVCGYEGLYEVSDYGRVRSLDRWVRYGDGRGRRQPGRVLKLLPDGGGYLRVNLAGTTRHVHSLVLEAFAGRCVVGMERLHGPGGRADNRWPENLRYGSKSENLGADKHRDGTMVHAKLNELAVLEFLDRRARGDSYAAIARDYGVTVPTVWNAVTGRSWRHINRGRLSRGVPQPYRPLDLLSRSLGRAPG
jgi:hypothetical protein